MGGRPTNATIAGVALLLFGGPLFVVGIAHVVDIGTCSSTGFDSDTGARVPFCPRGTGFWILFLIGGVFAAGGGISVLAVHRSKVTPVFAAPVTPVPPVAPAPDVTAELDRLTALHGQGALTDEELAAAKAKLLM